MAIAETVLDLIQDPTLRTVAMGTASMGALGGFIGTFAVIRRQSLLGDAISHAALPGVALAYLLGGRSATVLATGAAVVGWSAMILVSGIVRRSRLTFDAVLGGTLAVFFGIGLALMSFMQRHVPGASGHGLERYLFGQAATLRHEDVQAIAVTGVIAVVIVLMLWRQFQLLCFDPEFARTQNLPVRWLDRLLTALVVLAVVVGLQAVGVVLMSALLVAPAVAARQWTSRLSILVILSTIIGAASALTGTVFSHVLSVPRAPVPTGPTIVLCVSVVVIASLLFAEIWSRFRRYAT